MFSESELNYFMGLALAEAQKAYKKQEVPVGAVIVNTATKKVLARGYNRRITKHDATNHAEILCIKKACRRVKDFRLAGTAMFVTLFPCPMCMGGIVNARINEVYVGASSDRVDDSLIETIFNNNLLNHKVKYTSGILESECGALVKKFFKERRDANSSRT